MRHEDKDIALNVPDHWDDRTVVAFTAPTTPSAPIAPNVVITREKQAAGEDLEAYANRQLVLNARTVHDFKLLRHAKTTLGGAPAVQIDFAWRHEPLALNIRQRQVIFQRGPRMISVAITATDTDYTVFEADLEAILGSVQVQP